MQVWFPLTSIYVKLSDSINLQFYVSDRDGEGKLQIASLNIVYIFYGPFINHWMNLIIMNLGIQRDFTLDFHGYVCV